MTATEKKAFVKQLRKAAENLISEARQLDSELPLSDDVLWVTQQSIDELQDAVDNFPDDDDEEEEEEEEEEAEQAGD